MSIVSVIGLDLGDSHHYFCCLDDAGTIVWEGKVASDRESLRDELSRYQCCLVSMEAGSHSPWVSRLVTELGHGVVVGNPRKLRAIFTEEFKDDKRDARILARVARLDPSLLRPIRHRSESAHADLAVIRSREALVRCRTALISHVRGVVKSFGYRLRSCSAASFHRQVAGEVPSELLPAVQPVLGTIARLSAQIADYDRAVERLCSAYPETDYLRSIKGVGALTAASFVLTIDDPGRFASGRQLSAYLGLVPRRDKSGRVDKQLRITKAGDRYLRQLLVSCAHYIMGPFGEDSQLRRWGQALAQRGGRNARKRSIVAVARKLSVLLWRLWVDRAEYQPFPTQQEPAA